MPSSVKLLAAAFAVLAVLAAVWLGPLLLWAYNVEQAGALIDQGMAWPEPRMSDSIATVQDAQALDAALGHLAAAAAWRPDDAYAHRLAGQIYMARGDWSRAAAALEQARTRAPDNPLSDWEAGLAYEHMLRAIEQAPRISLMEAFAHGGVSAPGTLVRSLYCNDTGASSCYFGLGEYAQGFAETNQPAQTYPVLFLHAPAQLKQSVTVPAEATALDFVVGLDPVARTWASDGATFRVWVEQPAVAPILVYERTITPSLASEGWLYGSADLSRWAKQPITLVLETGAGPAGDVADDWYGWAEVALTLPDRLHSSIPEVRRRMQAAWRAGGFGYSALVERGKQARAAGRLDEAQRWFQRADVIAGRA